MDVTQEGWFAADDAARLAPAVVVNEAFYAAAGRPNLVAQPQVQVLGKQNSTAVIIGVMPNAYPEAMPQAFMLTEAAAAVGIGEMQGGGMGQELRIGRRLAWPNSWWVCWARSCRRSCPAGS
ncbi:hypothetical protein AOC05_02480 [Arthrobacter alpinus]|uniref:MacB-like periplasmic core domain-containing protein n=1 Tax=Arthrobacter alpinus TaxID=656366 RepID=A0A0M4R9T3_9MICC|nr:hypothetical protein [Arthrobacter alpinus]ALE91481.1 hypothetical protein AOC05_02480 [Arthrobacter alpinus]